MDIRIFKRMWMVYLNWSVRQLPATVQFVQTLFVQMPNILNES